MRPAYPLDVSRRFETRWLARLEAEGRGTVQQQSGLPMKSRERIERVKRVLETPRAKRSVRESIAHVRLKEAEGVERRQHPDENRKPSPAGEKKSRRA
jgi:hypothetical protein